MFKETYIDEDQNKMTLMHLPYLEKKQLENDLILSGYEIDPRIKKISLEVEQKFNNQKQLEKSLSKQDLRYQELEILKRNQTQAVNQLNSQIFDRIQPSQFKIPQYPVQSQGHSIKSTTIQSIDEDIVRNQTLKNKIPNQINHNYTQKQQVQSSSNKYWKNQTQLIDNNQKNQDRSTNLKLQTSKPHDCKICREQRKFVKRKDQSFQNKKETLDINKILLTSKLMIEQQKLNDAQIFMQKFIDLEIYEHSDLYFLYGDVLRQLGIFQEAEHYLLEALKFKVYSPFCLISLGQCYMSLNLYTRSVILFKRALEFQDTAVINHLLALSMIQNNQYLEAAIHLTRSIELDESNHILYLNRGTVYQKLGFQELAVSDYNAYKDLHTYWLKDQEQQISEAENIGDFALSYQLKELILQIQNV